MSVHSDDAGSTDTLSIAGSSSFWEPGNFKWTTKRIEDGNKLCSDYVTLLQERAELEKNYAKSLRSWSKKWEDHFDRVILFNLFILALWLMYEYSEVFQSMMQLKEKKEMDDRFRKEQKPWEKLYNKVNKARSDYHNARKNERTALNNQLNASRADPTTPDAPTAKKAAERVEKAKELVAKTRVIYEASLKEITEYNPYYKESMRKVFEACQEVEAVRLRFLKEILYDVHNCLNISSYTELPEIYNELFATIDCADREKDLRWWSQNRGVNMNMKWPEFEEYTEEFRDISKKHKNAGVAESPITLINQRSFGDEIPDVDNVSKSSKKKASKTSAPSSGSSNKNDGRGTNGKFSNPLLNSNQKQAKNAANKRPSGIKVSPVFEDEEWEEPGDEDGVSDNGEDGVPVKALYDYDGVEKDELTFKTGQVFEKLEDEDEQGWCKGRLDGRVGLYPANYVPTRIPHPQIFSGILDMDPLFHSGWVRIIIDFGPSGIKVSPVFEDEEWEEPGDEDGVSDNGEDGVPVKALYDYDGVEKDELTFKTGQVFEKLEDEDEQGWCKGRLDGRVGLYPANYVEVL
ncbi:unnamed protein product [Notodromas monacha]|uniref:SH3 domain-containing protein n=1 Tax=Notodromas monacha TaxID=399045 RepID=A0A7R9BYJ5_9CRUS|nr:unnamed protein product [Notodromas monacha]CAG0923201.1 unnamed protein product [Notodromas monacha]